MTTRSIKKPIILVTQTNKFPFVSRSFLEIDDNFWNYFKKTRNGSPEKYYVKKDGSLFQKGILPKKYQEGEESFVQILTFYHILKSGFFESNNGPKKFPPKLFDGFLKADTDEKLLKFINKYDFCDFPVKNDSQQREKDKLYLKYWSPKRGTRGLNWLHIYRKQQKLYGIYKNWSENNISIGEKNSLEKEISQNILSYSFDKNSFPFKEIEDYETEYEFNFDDFFGFKRLNKIEKVDGYIIFGHFAFCCFEFLKDIDNQRFCIEKNCHRPLPLSAHGNQKRCSQKDNPECYRKYKARARKIERKNERIRGKKKKIKIPKRTF